jgi:hypothetical protein
MIAQLQSLLQEELTAKDAEFKVCRVTLLDSARLLRIPDFPCCDFLLLPSWLDVSVRLADMRAV